MKLHQVALETQNLDEAKAASERVGLKAAQVYAVEEQFPQEEKPHP